MKKENWIVDFYGKRIARKDTDGDEEIISDTKGKILGKATKGGTTNFSGKVVSPNNEPGLLLPKQ